MKCHLVAFWKEMEHASPISKESQRRPVLLLLIGAMLAIFFGISLILRVCFVYDQVFAGEWVKFSGVDAYWHVRIVDNLVHNFPHIINFDPYQLFPGGGYLNNIQFFDWLLAGIIRILTLGTPTAQSIDTVSAYYPAVLGAISVLPAYFLGKELGSRWAGIISAALIAILPGEFLGRSILGFTDHHVAESLFSATTMIFLVMALKHAKQLTFFQFQKRNWRAIARPLIYASLTGIMLAVYILTWAGALLFVFIIALCLIVQFISDHLRNRSTDYLCIIGVFTFLVARLVIAPFYSSAFMNLALLGAMLIAVLARGVSYFTSSKRLSSFYYPVSLAVLGLAGAGSLYFIDPIRFGQILKSFSIFAPTGLSSMTTLEMQSILFPNGTFSLSVVWGNFSTSFPLLFIALGSLIYLFIKHGQAEKGVLLVWSLVMLAATFGQRRFAYYLAVNVAVLIGWLSWKSVSLAFFTSAIHVQANSPSGKKHRPSPYRNRYAVLGAIIIFLVIILPNIQPAYAIANQARYAPTDAWQSALSWMKDNTPEPFGNEDYYYKLYEASEQRYGYPESAYGVTAWWDYGYWIMRIAHRVPSCNPGQSPEPIIDVANLFLAQDAAKATEMMEKLMSSYIILDYKVTSTIFWAVATWAGRAQSEFSDIYYAPDKDNKLIAVRLFYPQYYHSLCVRLYNLDGREVTNPKPIVITYEEKARPDGQLYRQVTNSLSFTSYDDAVNYVETQKSTRCRIVSNNPFISPAPLEELKQFKLVYSSRQNAGTMPEIKIFQYLR